MLRSGRTILISTLATLAIALVLGTALLIYRGIAGWFASDLHGIPAIRSDDQRWDAAERLSSADRVPLIHIPGVPDPQRLSTAKSRLPDVVQLGSGPGTAANVLPAGVSAAPSATVTATPLIQLGHGNTIAAAGVSPVPSAAIATPPAQVPIVPVGRATAMDVALHPSLKYRSTQLTSISHHVANAAAAVPIIRLNIDGSSDNSTPATNPVPQTPRSTSNVQGDNEIARTALIDKNLHMEESRKFVMSMCSDPRGRIWVGCEPDTEGDTDGGVQCFDPAAPPLHQWTQYTTRDGLGDNYVYAVACDRKGRIWAGHLNHGVSVWNGERWQTYEVVGGLSRPDTLSGPLGERVFHITVNPKDGDVWIATNAGLSRYSESKDIWTYYTRAEGLPSDQASSMAFDKDGNIYAATQCDGIAMAAAADDYQHWRQVKGPDDEPTTATGDGLPGNLINDILVTYPRSAPLTTGPSPLFTIYAATDAGLAWSKDKGVHWQYIRGNDWVDKVKGRFGSTPKDWKETTGTTLAEDYCTCLGECNDETPWIGHRQQGYEAFNSTTSLIKSISAHGSYTTTITDSAKGMFTGNYGDGVTCEETAPRISTPIPTDMGIVIPELPSGAKLPTEEAIAETIANVSTSAAEPTAAYVGQDWRTGGDWVGRYGKQYAVLCSAHWPLDDCISHGAIFYDIQGDIGPNHPNRDALRHWMHWANPSYRRCLYNPMVGHRVESEWDDHGEAYSMSLCGPDIRVWIKVHTPGEQLISLYFVNKDGHGDSNRYRDYLISVQRAMPETSQELSNVLASARVVHFWGGAYAQFRVRGPGSFLFTIGKNYSHNAILSGIFIDRLTGPVTFVDSIPLPWFGDVRFDPPPVPEETTSKESSDLRQSLQLWNESRSERNQSVQTNWCNEVLAYRTANAANASAVLLENWRWSMRLWKDEDRCKFNEAVSRAWLEVQPVWGPVSTKYRVYP